MKNDSQSLQALPVGVFFDGMGLYCFIYVCYNNKKSKRGRKA